MPFIASVSTYSPPHSLKQDVTTEFARELFSDRFEDIERLLRIFSNGQIEERKFSVPLEWFQKEHSFQERNDLFIKLATDFSTKAISLCLNNQLFLKEAVNFNKIDAIILVTSSGIATPSLDARLMNRLPFDANTKRIPIWGLGCAGGAAGISRGYEYCRAFPEANVLVVCVELCSLTFQKNDLTKSNLVGTSLFADGVAAALIVGDKSATLKNVTKTIHPAILSTQSTLMENSENVMGWEVKDSGLHVVFSRDIPSIIKKWLRPNVEAFLHSEQITISELSEFIAHPGGKKVLEAYKEALKVDENMLSISKQVLQKNGNMSSPTVLFVLEKVMEKNHEAGDYGLLAALGPGFSSELVLLQWQEVDQ